MIRIWLTLATVLAALGFTAWATDFVTLQGESTIYSVRCEQGEWKGNVCSGRLVPGERFRFRALRQHEEVLFWTVGASGPSHKFSNCKVTDGRTWSCPPGSVAALTVTREMQRGTAVMDSATPMQPYHGVSKWRWILLKYGISFGHTSD